MKHHSRRLCAPLCGIFDLNSLHAARCAVFIWARSPASGDAHLRERMFRARSRACLKHALGNTYRRTDNHLNQ
ncbi:hypothetical protein D3Z50_07180 [Clostridiaceae bacterium]|nr:hypothetical protein [Clostridiaceae bacterium]